jgi:hypothetical protein
MSEQQEQAKPSSSHGGSQRPPWALVHDNERLRDKIVMLRLTDEEREVLARVADDASYRAMKRTERVVRGLLERLGKANE